MHEPRAIGESAIHNVHLHVKQRKEKFYWGFYDYEFEVIPHWEEISEELYRALLKWDDENNKTAS